MAIDMNDSVLRHGIQKYYYIAIIPPPLRKMNSGIVGGKGLRAQYHV